MSNPEIEKLMLSIPGRLSTEKLAGLNGAVQFDLDLDNTETWVLAIQDQKAQITRGKVTKPDATFMSGSEDFIALLSGDIEEIGWSFLQGKIVFEGNISILWTVLTQLRKD